MDLSKFFTSFYLIQFGCSIILFIKQKLVLESLRKYNKPNYYKFIRFDKPLVKKIQADEPLLKYQNLN